MADEYQEVADLLLRHATLSATNADLKDHQRKCSELAEKVRGRGLGAAKKQHTAAYSAEASPLSAWPAARQRVERKAAGGMYSRTHLCCGVRAGS